MKVFYTFVFILVFAFCNVSVAATAPGGWQEGISSTGQKQWFGPDNLTKSQAGMGRAIWNSVPSGVEVSRPVPLPFAGGVAEVLPKASVSPAAAAGAIGRAIPKLLKQVSGPLGVGMILYDLGKEMGFNLSKDESGGLSVEKSDSSVCTVEPCYQYKTYDYPGTESGSPLGSCSLFKSLLLDSQNEPYGYTIIIDSANETTCYTHAVQKSNGSTAWYNVYSINRTSVAPSLPTYDVSNQQAFLDAIAAKSGWPSGSAIAAALKASLDIDVDNYVPFTPISTTGPASVSAPTVKEITNDGTNTIEKTTNKKTDLGYSNSPHPLSGKSVPKVEGTTSTVTNITITNNTTGAVTNSNSTVNNPAEEPADLGEITDTPFAALPVLYTRKYPDGLIGVWNQKIVEIKATPLFSLVGNLMPANIGSSGSCPSFSLPVNFGQWGEYGTLDFSPPCFIWDFGKAVILISALLLARRLIFGG